MYNIDFLKCGLRGHQMRSKVEAFAETERPGFFRDERIRSGFDKEFAGSFGSDGAAETRGRFEGRQFNVERLLLAQFDDPMGSGESGDAAADDDDAPRHDKTSRGWPFEGWESLFSIFYPLSSVVFTFCSITSAII